MSIQTRYAVDLGRYKERGQVLDFISYPCTRCGGILARTADTRNEATGQPEPTKYVCQDCHTPHILVDVGPAGEAGKAIGG